MLPLSGSIDPGPIFTFAPPALLGLVCGLLAWLIGSAGRPGRLGLGASTLVGAAAGIVLIAPSLALGMILERPLLAIGLKSMANWFILGLLLAAMLSTCVTLLANAWYCRRKTRAHG